MNAFPYVAPVILLCEWSEIDDDGIACGECSREQGATVKHPVLPGYKEPASWVTFCPRTGNRPVILCLPEQSQSQAR